MNCRIIIPNCDRPTRPLVAYGAIIAEIAGGFTTMQGSGGWIDSAANLIVEPITIVDIHVDGEHSNGPKVRELRALCRQIAIDLDQECVYFGIGENVEYITQEDQR